MAARLERNYTAAQHPQLAAAAAAAAAAARAKTTAEN